MIAHLLAIQRDRRRAQRGSVLSAVLILVTFLAIISGALVTSLSTNFLLSRQLVAHATNEATVDSAMELALGQLQDSQATPIFNGCPSPTSFSPLPLNGLTAVAGYASCFPVIDRSASSAGGAYLEDGTHAAPPGTGVDEYLNGDAKGNLYAFANGSTTPTWTFSLGGEIVGTPLAMADVSAPSDGVSYLVPVTNPNNGQSIGCAVNCVALLAGDGGTQPSSVCLMSAGGLVMSQPAAGLGFPNVAYFGDSSGSLWAYSAVSSNQSALCDEEASASISANVPGAGAVVAGPFVFKSGTSKNPVDDVYAVVTNGSGGDVVHYTYTARRNQPVLTYVPQTLSLPAVPVGAALQNSLLAITFTNGLVATVQIQPNVKPTIQAQRSLGAPIADAPYWNSAGELGIGAGSSMFVRDSSLNPIASYTGSGSGSAIVTTPTADNGGDWFFASVGGTLYEAQVAGSILQVRTSSSNPGNITSAPLALRCGNDICIYMGSSSGTNGSVYFAGLDSRDALLDSCITACSGGNFGLRAHVDVGAAKSPQTVHIQGWAYYLP